MTKSKALVNRKSLLQSSGTERKLEDQRAENPSTRVSLLRRPER